MSGPTRERESTSRLRQVALYAIGLTLIAVSAASVIVFVFHEFYRPELQTFNTGLATAVSIVVAFPICLMVSRLIYNLKATKSALEIAKKRAVDADVAKSEFLANMSHEIRTPMNGVLGMAELLGASDLDERQALFVNTINRSGAALLTIINDILDFSKIEAGRLELDSVPFDLCDAVEDVVSLLTPRAHEKNLQLALRCAPDLPATVIGDVGRIRQIVTNLVGNAIKFTHEGRVDVDLAVDGDADPRDGEAAISVTVRDTGIGIPADKIETVFQKFSQAESSTTREFGGTGLGLTISRCLADAMGGGLSVESELGAGSAFKFSFSAPIASGAPVGVKIRDQIGAKPVDKASAASIGAVTQGAITESAITDGADTVGVGSPDSTRPNEGAFLNASDVASDQRSSQGLVRKPRVLVAEDNEVNRLVVQNMIGSDYDLLFAEDGEEAYGLFQTAVIDVVLMDVSMPTMDGYEATKAIRAFEAREGRTATPIICLTAHAQIDERELSLGQGMNDYLSKPIRREALHACLQKWAHSEKARSGMTRSQTATANAMSPSAPRAS